MEQNLGQLRRFVFTYNNPTVIKEEFIEIIRAKLECDYILCGYEHGALNGTPHFQGYVELTKRVRFKKIVESVLPHKWRIARAMGNAEHNLNYISKEDPNPSVLGTPKTSCSLADNNSKKWTEMLRLAREGLWDELKEQYPGEYIRHLGNLHKVHVEVMNSASSIKKCLWLFGRPGCGKSRFAHDYDNAAYFKNPNKWWDNFDETKHKTIIIDDLEPSHSVLGYHIKRWADRYPVLCETKGGSIYANYDILIVTSNYRPETIWPNDTEMQDAIKRRFHIYEVMDLEESLEGILSIKTSKPENLYDYVYLNKFNIFD